MRIEKPERFLAERARRDEMMNIEDHKNRVDSFYNREVRGFPWQKEFDGIWESYMRGT